GGYGRGLLRLPLRRIAPKKSARHPSARSLRQGAEAQRMERIPHSLRRKAHPALGEWRPDGRLYRTRRYDRAIRAHRRANPRRRQGRGALQGFDHRRTAVSPVRLGLLFLLAVAGSLWAETPVPVRDAQSAAVRELVNLNKLDAGFRFDLRYATPNN